MARTLRKTKKIVLWLIAFAVIAAFFLPLISKRREIAAKNNQLQAQLLLEQQKNRAFLEKKDKLENDPFYMEKIARQKLGITRDKEVLYKVVTEPVSDPEQDSGDETGTTVETEKTRNTEEVRKGNE